MRKKQHSRRLFFGGCPKTLLKDSIAVDNGLNKYFSKTI
ncbi:hypothetical protein SD77_1872 [Bacillus badius]|uniref:Ribose 5-phosphate isomerase B n=1 Tax=Bacillus badius TaxID=1455 RepID=A0ABR5AQ70_BACBA|nr:hypothetical protein SD77_1872 [Bacillus badius]